MKIIIISDTHIPNRAEELPEAFFKKAKGADLILHAGDLVTVKLIKTLEKIAPLKGVCGNMDSLEVRGLLKQKEILKIDGVSIGIMHGSGSPINLISFLKEEFKADEVDIIVFGHSHLAFKKKIGKILFFNPGSLTDSFVSGYPSYGVIEIVNGKFKAKVERL